MLQKDADTNEVDDSLDLSAVAVWLTALGYGLIIRVVGGPESGFQSYLPIFETLVRHALRP